MAVTHGHGNPDWSREESILALDLYFEFKGIIPGPKHEKVRELSKTLRSLPYHAVEARKESFRNPDGVGFKLQNLRQVATGKGLGNVSRMDRQIWEEFGKDPERLRELALRIREASFILENFEPTDENDEEFSEGLLLTVLHKRRERDPKIRLKLIDQRRRTKSLKCEICNASPRSKNPKYEVSMFEAHHTFPLSSSGERITRLSEMALLCANCHRMLHRAIAVKKSWLSIEEAKKEIFGEE